MKKILIITLEYPPQIGGIASYVRSLAGAFDPAQTIVLAPEHKDAPAEENTQGYTVVRRSLLFPKYIWPRWLSLMWTVNRMVKEHGVELILVHHVLPVGYIALIMKRWRGIPFLLFSHGTDLVAGTATWWKKRLVRLVAHRAEQIIFNSESLQRRFLERIPECSSVASVVYPCPDSEFFTPPGEPELKALRHQYALEGKQVMLSISRLDEGKGFPHLIRYLPEALHHAPNLVWLIIGNGPKKDTILKQIRMHDLQNIVRFVGEVPHHKIKDFYYLAHLFVLLTHPDQGREEGLGLVFLEASAAGLPILAGRSGGVEEAVIHGETGLVVDTYDKAQVLSALHELLHNPTYAHMLGQHAKERIMADFQWEHQVRRLDPWLE